MENALTTDLLYLSEHPRRTFEFDAGVVAVKPEGVVLDRTYCFVESGGQLADTGWIDGEAMTDVRRVDGQVIHVVDQPTRLEVGQPVHVRIDRARVEASARTHTGAHVIVGVAWREWRAEVVGAQLALGSGHLDLRFDEVPADLKPRLEALVNAEVLADRPVTVSFLDREEVESDPELARFRLALQTHAGDSIRIVDILGLDREPDGGTHVESTGVVGAMRIERVENKGRGVRRVRFTVQARQ
ncbi:MAG: alanyl-tRNA editing protein [Actinomycetota bacterium]